jgi:alpha-tubulin suppressor-like RCC1 family protein
MAFKKVDVIAPDTSGNEVEFFEQWSENLTKAAIKTLDGTTLPITKIIKAKSGKGFSLVVENHCLIWVWGKSSFGTTIKEYISNPIGRPAIIPSLNKLKKDFEFGFDDEITITLHSMNENTWVIEPTNPKLP